jgi:hypothetical protein
VGRLMANNHTAESTAISASTHHAGMDKIVANLSGLAYYTVATRHTEAFTAVKIDDP